MLSSPQKRLVASFPIQAELEALTRATLIVSSFTLWSKKNIYENLETNYFGKK